MARLQALHRAPPHPAGSPCVQFEQFWVEAGPLGQPGEAATGFVATPSVRGHLRNLARAVQLRKHPILLQARPQHQCKRLCGPLGGSRSCVIMPMLRSCMRGLSRVLLQQTMLSWLPPRSG